MKAFTTENITIKKSTIFHLEYVSAKAHSIRGWKIHNKRLHVHNSIITMFHLEYVSVQAGSFGGFGE
jgi:hypothetical protein